jgi:hypothetical protein
MMSGALCGSSAPGIRTSDLSRRLTPLARIPSEYGEPVKHMLRYADGEVKSEKPMGPRYTRTYFDGEADGYMDIPDLADRQRDTRKGTNAAR